MSIYIWSGNNADEQTGLRYYLYLLKEKRNEIFLMNATERYGGEEQSVFHSSQMDSESFRVFLESDEEHKPLSDKKRLQFHNEWEKLAQTKDVLRLWGTDEIKSMPADHYDRLILETIEKLHNDQGTKDFIQTGSVLGELLTEIDTYIDIFFLEYRIRYLVYSGVLELKGIPKSAWHYSVKIR